MHISTLKHIPYPQTYHNQLLTNFKNIDKPKGRQGAPNNIPCYDHLATYIVVRGRNLKVQLTEHKHVTRNSDLNNNISEHNNKSTHNIDWDSVTCIACSMNYRMCILTKTLSQKLVYQLRENSTQQLPTTKT